jgi:hypothetical protein
MRQWYFTRHGQTRGPYTDEQFRALASSGQLLPDDLVSYSGASNWLPARQVPDLFSARPPLVPPSSPAARSPLHFLKPLLGLPKPVLFGVFGGIGGLLGALVLGEALWALLSPAGFRGPQPQVRLGIPATVRVYQGGTNRFVVKVAREHFTGPIRIEAHKPPDGVSLAPATVPDDADDVEVEVQTAPGLPPGAHSLTLRASAPGNRNVQEESGTIEVTAEQPPPRLRLSVPAEITAFQGGKTRFHIKLARHHFAGPVKLRFDGLPETVVLEETTVDADSSDEEFTVQVPEQRNPGEWRVTVVGMQEERMDRERARGAAAFNLRVRPLPIPQADVVFVLDLTGSMQFAIDGIKEGIQNFVSQLETSRIDARIALIGFRDIEDDRERPFVMAVEDQPFTKDYRGFREEVRKLTARGGGDEPESSLQALALAAAQPFRSNASRVLLLITDAPPKLHPDERPSTVSETITALTRSGIHQLHLVVRSRDYESAYSKFHDKDKLKGSFFDLTRTTSREAFRDILPELSRKISTLTIASQPRAPAEASPLPPLPVEAPAALPPPAPVAPVVKAVQSTKVYTRHDRGRLLLAIAVWTMAVAGCISLLILAGQRFYACLGFVGLVEGGNSMGGGFLAGLVGGAAGQLLFQNTAGGTGWEVVSRLLGWGLLGGLIGAGVSFFVPNLKWWRGLVGGLVGGLLGAVGFVLVSVAAGSFVGRWIGAAILGFFIGLMVALAEVAFRRYWLEVAFSPREVRTVTLGTRVVSVGADERRVAIAVPGSVPIALRYWMDGDRVLLQDVIKEETGEVVPGDRRMLGKVAITLCSAAHGRKVGYTLQLSNGAAFRLVEGLPLTEDDLPGSQAQGADGVVAVVASRPNDPARLLLCNRSKQTWVVSGSQGNLVSIGPGRGVELAPGVSISFGQLRGTLRRDAR